MKKVKIDGKTYILKEVEETPETTEEEVAEVAEEVAPEAEEAKEVVEETEEEVAENLEEVADEATKKVMKKLGLDTLIKDINELKKSLKDSTPVEKDDKTAALIDIAKLMKKDVSSLTSREKIVGFFQAMIQTDHAALKALSEGVAADGGYLFPDEFRAEVIRDIEDTPHMRNEVTIIPMTRDVMKIPTLESAPKVTWTEENATKSTTTAHFNEATLTVKKMAAIMYISDELVEDSTEIDIVNFIIKLFSEAIGNEEDKVITDGNGTTQPTGYAQAAGVGTRAVAGNLNWDDLINLVYDLPQKYHPNAKFYVHRNNIRELRQLKDANGRYLWQDAIAPGQPSTFHGYPVVEDNNLPESEIYFGDLKKAYWLGDRKRMTVKISQDTETAFTKDQTAIRVVSRIAGTVVLTQALKKLNSIP